MKLDDTVMVQFFGELIESYRQQIMDQEEARELSKKEKKFLADLRKELELSNPQAYRMVTELFGCMLDISQIKQEQLYIQGIKDGIPVSYTHLRAHETGRNLVCRLLLEKKKNKT